MSIPVISPSQTLWIRQAQMLQADGELSVGDMAVRSGKIVEMAEQLPPAPAEDIEIDAQGLVLLPGMIDPQVHFRDPGLTHKEDLHTASRACARGGVTSFLEMPNTKPLTTTQDTLDAKLAIAAEKSLVNYGFFMGATPANLPDLRDANPTPGIKIFMGSMHGDLLVDVEEKLEPIFAQGSRLIAVHAEDQGRIAERRQAFRDRFGDQLTVAHHSQIQDEQAALNATQLALKLSKKYQRRLHILHLSTGIEAEFLRQHKPAWVTAEVTPQHLLLNIHDYDRIGTLAQMNPPLRSPENNEVLWRALLDGVIDFIATDHAPHTLAEKAQAYPHSPSGMPGVETSLPLMLTQAKQGRCTLAQVVRWMSTAVAEAYQIPHKGKLEPGYDADLILVDWNQEKLVCKADLQTKCGWSPFEGWSLTGWPVITIVNGQIIFNDRLPEDERFNEQVRGTALTFSAP
ncbi:MAG: dihydroorotase [Prochlorotrichaceae cyanobacterium]|jgi:dihydroorotase